MIDHIEKMAKSNPRVAEIPTINPGCIWGCGVFNIHLIKDENILNFSGRLQLFFQLSIVHGLQS